MNAIDPSLDARIWAYVRGEGGPAERKKLEELVSSDPAAARRYASIKLLQQREQSPGVEKGERQAHAPPSAKAGSKRAEGKEKSRPSSPKADLGFLLLAMGMLAICGVLYAMRSRWPMETRLLIRDGLHLAAVVLGLGMALSCRKGRFWVMAIATTCIGVGCAAAAMLVR